MVMATGRPWGQYLTRPAITSRTTTSSSSRVFRWPPFTAALQAMVWSTASRAAWGSAPPPVSSWPAISLRAGSTWPGSK